MNGLDFFLLILFAWNAFIGYRIGLVKSLANTLGWFCALILAAKNATTLQSTMAIWFDDPVLQKVSAFIMIVIVVVAITFIVGLILQKVISTLKLSWLNRLAGGVFGLCKTMCVIMILIYATSFWLIQTKIGRQSHIIDTLAPYAQEFYQIGQDVAQKTSQQFQQPSSDSPDREKHKTDNISPSQNAIIEQPLADQSKQQTNNPFL